MIFAELDYDQHYGELHTPLVELLGSRFQDMEPGLQGDSWIWVFEGGEKVAVDSFSSMKHQVKADASSTGLAEKVIGILSTRYQVNVFTGPELELHEEEENEQNEET